MEKNATNHNKKIPNYSHLNEQIIASLLCYQSCVFTEYILMSVNSLPLLLGLIRDVKLRSLYNTINSSTQAHSECQMHLITFWLLQKSNDVLVSRREFCSFHRVDRPLFIFNINSSCVTFRKIECENHLLTHRRPLYYSAGLLAGWLILVGLISYKFSVIYFMLSHTQNIALNVLFLFFLSLCIQHS